MSSLIDPRQRFIHNTAVFMLSVCALASGTAAILHSRQPDPRTLDLVMPVGFSIVMLSLVVWLWLRPDKLIPVIWAGYAAGLAVLIVPSWYYTLQAWRGTDTLVGTLPPISSALLALIVVQIVFLRPRQVFIAATIAWIITALPVLVYLIAHPKEMITPRGMDLVVTYGPTMMLMLVFIPFHRGIERWMDALQRDRARMEQLAERDGLTGLYNRRASETLLVNLLAKPDGNDALILFDIDRFKGINDTYGHPAGDEVLRQVARRCEAVLRRGDVFARWGGEEFLVLVRGANEEGMARVAESMRAAIAAAPIPPAGTITASFGVARFHAYDTLDTWISRADNALYDAKRSGRDRVVAAA